ncbi:unnamed protein product [Gordionus sp. m RMFG-2023]
MGMGNISNQFSMASRKNILSETLRKGLNYTGSDTASSFPNKSKKGTGYDEELEANMYLQNHLYLNPSENELFSNASSSFGSYSSYQSQKNKMNNSTGYFNHFRNNSSPNAALSSYHSNFNPSAFFSQNKSQSQHSSNLFSYNFSSTGPLMSQASTLTNRASFNSLSNNSNNLSSLISANKPAQYKSNFSNSTSINNLNFTNYNNNNMTYPGNSYGYNYSGIATCGNAGSGFTNNTGFGNAFNYFGGGSKYSKNFNDAFHYNSSSNHPPLDPSEFPSLRHNQDSAGLNFNSFLTGNVLSGTNNLGMGKQNSDMQHQQHEFQIHNEDFPALPGIQSKENSQPIDNTNILNNSSSTPQTLSAQTSTHLLTSSSKYVRQSNSIPNQEESSSLDPNHELSRLVPSMSNNAHLPNQPPTAPSPINYFNINFNPDLLTSISVSSTSHSIHKTNISLNSTSARYQRPNTMNSQYTEESHVAPTKDIVKGASKEMPITYDKGDVSVSKENIVRGIRTYPDGRVTDIPHNMVRDQFGMVGLLTFIRSAETAPNLVRLGLGSDLTTFGLNLNSSEPLYQTFAGPFTEKPCKPHELIFPVPSEYMIGSQIKDKLPSLQTSKYGEDLLFFLFYTFNNDLIQLIAAQELYERDWRFHLDEKIWLTKIPGLQSVEKSPTYERGTYYFFDPVTWRKLPKEFLIYYGKLEDKPTVPQALINTFYQINSPDSIIL